MSACDVLIGTPAKGVVVIGEPVCGGVPVEKTAVEQLSEMLEVEVTAIAAYRLGGTYYFAVTTGGEDKAIQCDGGTGVLCVSMSADSVTGVYAQVPLSMMPLNSIYKQGLFADDFSFLIGESLEVKEF